MTTVAEEPITLRRASLSDDLNEVTREVNAGRSVLEPGLRPWPAETIARWLQDPSFANGRYVYFVCYGHDIVGVLPCQRFADDLFLGDVYLRAPMRQPEPLDGLLAALLEQAVNESIKELLVETGYQLSVPPRALHQAGFRYKRTTYFVSRAPLPARILTPAIENITVAVEETESISGTRLRSLYDRLYRPSPSDWPEAPSAIEKRLRMAVEQTPILVVARTPRKEVGYVCGKYDPGRRNFHMEEIGIDQEERGKQLSRVLISRLIEAARELGAGSLSARVQSDNTVAVHLLRRLGFRTERRWRVYAATPRKAKKRANVRLVLDGPPSELGGMRNMVEDEVDLMSGDATGVTAGLPSARAKLHRPSAPRGQKTGRKKKKKKKTVSEKAELVRDHKKRDAAAKAAPTGAAPTKAVKTSKKTSKPKEVTTRPTPTATKVKTQAGEKKTTAKKAPAKKKPAKKAPVKKKPAKKAPVKKKPAKKAPVKKKPAKKAPAKKKPVKKAPAKKAPAKKAPAKKKPAKKAPAKKAPAKKAPAKKKPAKKKPAKKKPAKKAQAKKKPAAKKKASPRKRK